MSTTFRISVRDQRMHEYDPAVLDSAQRDDLVVAMCGALHPRHALRRSGDAPYCVRCALAMTTPGGSTDTDRGQMSPSSSPPIGPTSLDRLHTQEEAYIDAYVSLYFALRGFIDGGIRKRALAQIVADTHELLRQRINAHYATFGQR